MVFLFGVMVQVKVVLRKTVVDDKQITDTPAFKPFTFMFAYAVFTRNTFI